jgi:hypothetical protein
MRKTWSPTSRICTHGSKGERIGHCRRRAIAFEMEDLCRWHQVPGDPPAGLAQGRAIFQHCLMYGRPAGAPAVAVTVPDAAASLSADPLAALKEELREHRGDPLPSPDRQPKAEALAAPAPRRRHGLVARPKAQAAPPAAPEPEIDPKVEAERREILRRAATTEPPVARTAPPAPQSRFIDIEGAESYWRANGPRSDLIRRPMPEVHRGPHQGLKERF